MTGPLTPLRRSAATLPAAALAALLVAGSAAPAVAAAGDRQAIGRVEHQGIVVELAVRHLRAPVPSRSTLTTGTAVGFEVAVHDTATGSPLSGAYPALWLHPREADPDPSDGGTTPTQRCNDQAGTFIGGSLFSRAELDLNVFHVVTLNDDASLTVLDPRFGFGAPGRIHQVELPSPGYDWAHGPDARQLFVSLPADRSLLRVDTTDWRTKRLAIEGRPGQLALQPDQRYLWVTVEDGVTVFDTAPLRPIARIDTTERPSIIAFDPDSRHAYLALREAGSIAVIDVATLRPITTVTTGAEPVSMDYSGLAAALYVSHAGDGRITAIDGRSHQVVAQTQSEPGLGMLRFLPNQRWALIVNPVTDRLSILDAASNRIVQSGLVDDQPDRIAFSDQLAYIRHRGSETLWMLTLDDPAIGRAGTPIPLVDTPGGDRPPGATAMPTPAAGIVKAPGASAVVIANPGDGAVYFYNEGMAAPMGQVLTPGRAPRAVLALDRSLKERRRPGVYETFATLPAAGDYDLVLFMDRPRFVHCLSLSIDDAGANPGRGESKPVYRFVAEPAPTPLRAGQPARLRFRLGTDGLPESVDTAPGPVPVNALISMSSGQWSRRQTLSTAADGSLELSFRPPLPGDYQLYLESDRLGLTLPRLRPHPVFVE